MDLTDGGATDTESDPFDADQPDPSKCHALESSLWETTALLSHYFPDVARLPKVLETPYLRKHDMNMARAASSTYASLLEVSAERCATAIATIFSWIFPFSSLIHIVLMFISSQDRTATPACG